MQAAAAAYLTDTRLVEVIFPSALEVKLINNEKTDTQVLLITWMGVAVAAVRGTQVSKNFSLVDVIRNMRVVKKSWHFDKVRAHAGYSSAADSVMGEVAQWLERHREAGRRCYLTGHSMGGVIASGLAANLKFDATYTFGAPRFGNKAFAKLMKKESLYRVVHESDIAPSYPHAGLGYRHAGERWQLGREGGFEQIDGWSKDFWHFPYLQGQADHEPGNYLLATRKGHRL
jgi:predicted lipase